MNDILFRLRGAMASLWYGRCGMDLLNWALVAVSLALNLAGSLVRGHIPRTLLSFLATAVFLLLLLRAFSRDLPRRRAENDRFLALAARPIAWWQRRADRDHKYVKCSCGVWCRVPRNVGRVELMCPKCGEKTLVETGQRRKL